MKVAHRNKKPISAGENAAKKAILSEKEGDRKEAITSWKHILKEHPFNSRAYDRLMILYRKEKDYKKELAIINTAIRLFEKRFREISTTHSAKVKSLSRSLLIATGLGDDKGNNLYQPGELSRWKKRKVVVEKRFLKQGVGPV